MATQADSARTPMQEPQMLARNSSRPINPNVRRAISSYKETKTKPSYLLRLLLHVTKPEFEKTWLLSPSVVVYLTQPQHYNQLNLAQIVDQQKESTGAIVGCAALPFFTVITLKRFFRARSPLISLTQRGGKTSTLLFSFAIIGLLQPFYKRTILHRLQRNNERLYGELAISKPAAEEQYRRWLNGPLEASRG